MPKPNLKIVENVPPPAGYKDGDGGGQPPTAEKPPANDPSYGWRVPVGIVALVALAVSLASIDTGLLLGLLVLSTLALPWLAPWGWVASVLIWVGLLVAFA